MRREILDVDGERVVVATEGPEYARFQYSGESPFDVVVDLRRDVLLADVETLDALIAALQEAREEIAGRKTITSAPRAFSIADSSSGPG